MKTAASPPALVARRPAPLDGSGVVWIRDQDGIRAAPALPTVTDRPERTAALLVATLTLVCTLLAIYDLFLLAAGA